MNGRAARRRSREGRAACSKSVGNEIGSPGHEKFRGTCFSSCWNTRVTWARTVTWATNESSMTSRSGFARTTRKRSECQGSRPPRLHSAKCSTRDAMYTSSSKIEPPPPYLFCREAPVLVYMHLGTRTLEPRKPAQHRCYLFSVTSSHVAFSSEERQHQGCFTGSTTKFQHHTQTAHYTESQTFILDTLPTMLQVNRHRCY